MALFLKSKSPVFFTLLPLFFLSFTSFAQEVNSIKKSSGYKDSILVENKLSSDDKASLQKWRQRKEFGYMNYLDSLLRKQDSKVDTVNINAETGKIIKNKTPDDESAINKFLNSFPLKIFFWTMAVFFIVFIFNKIFLKNGLFKRDLKYPIENSQEHIFTDLHELSKYDSLINDAESKNDFNLSTRYLYLKTLKNLSEKTLIHFSFDKTNRAYLTEMESSNSYDQFVWLTKNYEFVWYGKFLINKDNYYQLKEEFIAFNKSL